MMVKTDSIIDLGIPSYVNGIIRIFFFGRKSIVHNIVIAAADGATKNITLNMTLNTTLNTNIEPRG